jgi:SOUL heme-binding protein
MPHALLRISLFLLPWISGLAMAVEEPRYEVIRAEGDFELRRYPPLLIAQTIVDGDRDQASRKGFQLLADYIFGNNQSDKGSGKIAMTAPVVIEPAKIAMTAPVTIQGQTGLSEAGPWRVHFVMPSQYTLASIPKPRCRPSGLWRTSFPASPPSRGSKPKPRKPCNGRASKPCRRSVHPSWPATTRPGPCR